MPSLHKKAKGKMVNRGVLEVEGCRSRACNKSSTKTPVMNGKSKAAGPGAGRLAAPNSQGVDHESLPGPSSRKELVGTTVQDQLPWVEGSEEDTTMDEKGELFQIPKGLDLRHRRFLEAMPDDFANGTIQEVKCRLWPDAGFSDWYKFRRHCDKMEVHPQNISFCQYCGDFFTRKETLRWHEETRAPECVSITEAEAAVKCTETQKAHDAFQEKLKRCLANTGEAWTPFAQIIVEMFPNSSKKGSRQQCGTKAPRPKA
jgi:hypothetical protein